MCLQYRNCVIIIPTYVKLLLNKGSYPTLVQRLFIITTQPFVLLTLLCNNNVTFIFCLALREDVSMGCERCSGPHRLSRYQLLRQSGMC